MPNRRLALGPSDRTDPAKPRTGPGGVTQNSHRLAPVRCVGETHNGRPELTRSAIRGGHKAG